MSRYTIFAVVGAGTLGNYIVQQLLKDKAAGIVKEVVVLTRQVWYSSNNCVIRDIAEYSWLDTKGSKTTVQGDAKVVQVDYTNDESIKRAVTGVEVVISTISWEALDVQGKIAAAAKEAGVKLFIPSDFGNVTEGETEGIFGAKANIQSQLKTLGLPYVVFYTGPFADYIWAPFINLDVTSGKVAIGGDGNKQISFTSRPDIARYVSYVLTHLPPEQLKNRAFTIAGDNKSFNEIFKAYEEKTGKKLQVTNVPISELDARIAANPLDVPAVLHKLWATAGPFPRTDNDLYPGWNPSPVIDDVPVA
ncbi:NAD-P-binding protein [Russula emetica]|nr:NAD-P-binding protein [Russula emetica]